ncbi:MAG TPA: biopolymer transporter ExbD [Caulobacter sp.]|nr:biopolymer transporter ExbD [Caulobacter sp.]
MGWKRILGLTLSAVAFALVVWGLFFAKPPLKLAFFKVGIVTESTDAPQPTRLAEPKPVDIYLHGDGSVWVGDKRSSLDLLVGDIVAQAESPDKELQRVFVHENVEVPYDVYQAVMAKINAAGWRRIELDTQRGDPGPAESR